MKWDVLWEGGVLLVGESAIFRRNDREDGVMGGRWVGSHSYNNLEPMWDRSGDEMGCLVGGERVTCRRVGYVRGSVTRVRLTRECLVVSRVVSD